MKIKKIFVFILIFYILISSIFKYAESTQTLSENSPIKGYTHTVLVEVATSQNCNPCDSWNENIYNVYISGDYEFEFVEMIIYDHNGNVLNQEAYNWANNHNIYAYPTSIFDDGYQKILGNQPDSLPIVLNASGNRVVKNIYATILVTWLGNATIKIDIEIKNNEQTQYNGHIRASITEIISRYDTYNGNPYHFGFLDFAFNKHITINPGETYIDSIIWDGNQHYDNHGDSFGDIVPENIQIVMGVINNKNGYVDETVVVQITGQNNPPNEPGNPFPPNKAKNVGIYVNFSWSCSDPNGDSLTYDVYFGTTSFPTKVSSNQSEKNFNPGKLDNDVEYYWRIVAWDDKGASTQGPLWSFTTEEKINNAPKVKIIKPNKGLYIFDKKILPKYFSLTKVIGSITIEVNATDEDSGIEKVEFYINNRYMGNDTTYPYTYFWKSKFLRFFHIVFIKVIAYDLDGKRSTARIIVKRYL